MTPRPLLQRRFMLLLGALVVFLTAWPITSADASPNTSAGASAGPGHVEVPSPDPRPVVVIGAAGLSWEDITPGTTPALWSLSRDGVGSLIVRSVRRTTCPLDGWLGLNTGARAADDDSTCRGLTEPVDGRIADWEAISRAVTDQKFSATLGAFAATLDDLGVDATSIGPGGAVALAGADGRAADHLDRVAAGFGLTAQIAGAAGSDLLVIDAGSIRPATDATFGGAHQHHADQVRIINRRVAAILDGLTAAGTDPVIVLAGLADTDEPGLRTLAISGPGWRTGELVSSSTRQDGFVLATDLQATIIQLLGLDSALPAGALAGSPATLIPTDATPTQLIDAAVERNTHEQARSALTGQFFLSMALINLALFAVVALGLKRPTISKLTRWWRGRGARRRSRPAPPDPDLRGGGPEDGGPGRRDPGDGELGDGELVDAGPAPESWLPPRMWVLRGLRLVAISVGALPVASFFADFVPWWRASVPGLALALATLAWMALLAAVALLGPWRRHVLGSTSVIAAITAGFLAIDLFFGAPMQTGGIMGSPALVAGRFYGMNNTSFALFTAGAILVSIPLAQPFLRRGRRWAAAGVVMALALAATVLDGSPRLGADFGGPPAILSAFLVLALSVLGVRLTWKRLVAVIGVAGLASLGIAFIDWLRPAAERTHLGAFFDTLLNGEVFPVIWRKLDQNLSILLGNRPLTLLAIAGVLTVVFVLARPIRGVITDPRGGRFSWLSNGTPISQMTERAPLLGRGIVALGVAGAVGMAVNDSGIAIPANMVALSVPLLLAASATWMLTLEPASAGAVDEPVSPALTPSGRGGP